VGPVRVVIKGDRQGKEVNSMSNQEAMSQLADRFMNDADFREQMRQDPEGAAERSGLQLDEEDKQALKSMDWSSSDEELHERVSKWGVRWC
jgi:hypothetical protein